MGQLPAGTTAGLSLYCLPMTVVVGVVQLVCGPQRGPRLRLDRLGLETGVCL
jgi:hypothetical protein